MKLMLMKNAALFAVMLLTGCGDSGPGPSTDQIRTALDTHTRQVFAGCPYFKYSGLERQSAEPIDGRENVYSVTVDYDFASFAQGEDTSTAQQAYQHSHALPDWLPQGCIGLFEGTPLDLGGEAGTQRLETFLQHSYARAGFSEVELQAMSPQKMMQKKFHVARATLHLRKGADNDWRLVDE